jgi:hypothetical protein
LGRQHLIEAGRRLIETLKEVSILVQGDLDRGMPGPRLDDLGMLTLGDQHRHMGVAQVVKAHRLTNRGLDRRQEDAATVLPYWQQWREVARG